jgi:hypothetical protein
MKGGRGGDRVAPGQAPCRTCPGCGTCTARSPAGRTTAPAEPAHPPSRWAPAREGRSSCLAAGAFRTVAGGDGGGARRRQSPSTIKHAESDSTFTGGWTPHGRRKIMKWDDGGDAEPRRVSEPIGKPWKLVLEPVNHPRKPWELVTVPVNYSMQRATRSPPCRPLGPTGQRSIGQSWGQRPRSGAASAASAASAWGDEVGDVASPCGQGRDGHPRNTRAIFSFLTSWSSSLPCFGQPQFHNDPPMGSSHALPPRYPPGVFVLIAHGGHTFVLISHGLVRISSFS